MQKAGICLTERPARQVKWHGVSRSHLRGRGGRPPSTNPVARFVTFFLAEVLAEIARLRERR